MICQLSDTTGPAPKSGRQSSKTCVIETKRIRLKPEVFSRWVTKKESLGYFDKTNSQFAEFLLDVTEQAAMNGPSATSKSKFFYLYNVRILSSFRLISINEC